MALDLQEQEQLDALKAWWKAHGTRVIAAVAVFIVAVAGWRAYAFYQHKQRLEAAALFQVLAREFDGGDIKKIRAVSGEIIDKYPGTPYAVDAALLAAQANHRAGDLKSAKSQLQWVIEHARDRQSQDVARLNLAAVLLDEGAFDAALKTLAASHDEAFEALYSERRADVLAAQGQLAAAREAYRAALARLPMDAPARVVIEIKLDALESRA